MATVRGCLERPGVAAGSPVAQAGQWRVADVDLKRFGEIVPHGDLGDPAQNAVLTVGAQQKRLHCLDGQIVSLELVEDFEAWKEHKRPGLPGGDAGDLRLLACERLTSGKRHLPLSRALERMSDTKFNEAPRPLVNS